MQLASLEPPLPPHDILFNASEAITRADLTFSLRGRLAEVKIPAEVALAHWTGPFPIRAHGVPNVYTLHDVIPLQYPHLVLDRVGRVIARHAAIARTADLIITVSEQSREDISHVLRLPLERISVTYQPAPELPAIDREDAERLVSGAYAASPGNYAFFCGALEPKKNLCRLIEAFAIAGDLPLLIAGPRGWLYDDILNMIDNLKAGAAIPAQAQVRWLGYLPRRHIVALMKCARFFTFPSIYEGFGIPLLEAMELGVPVMTSSCGGQAEVVGDAGLLVDPLDIDGMARAIRILASDADLRRDLTHRGRQQVKKFSRAAYLDRLDVAYRKVGVTLNWPAEPAVPADPSLGRQLEMAK